MMKRLVYIDEEFNQATLGIFGGATSVEMAIRLLGGTVHLESAELNGITYDLDELEFMCADDYTDLTLIGPGCFGGFDVYEVWYITSAGKEFTFKLDLSNVHNTEELEEYINDLLMTEHTGLGWGYNDCPEDRLFCEIMDWLSPMFEN